MPKHSTGTYTSLPSHDEDLEDSIYGPSLTHQKVVDNLTTKLTPPLQQQWSLRALLEFAMLMAIIVLLVLTTWLWSMTNTFPVLEDAMSGAHPFPSKHYTFKADTRFVNHDVFTNSTALQEALHQWLPLSTSTRGFVIASNNTTQLSEPYHSDPFSLGGPRDMYMVTVFHQLHCLSYLIQFYSATKTPKIYEHIAHCFDYLRQGIMCSADTTLEGETEEGDGWGSRHVCKDYGEVREWAERLAPWEIEREGSGWETVDVVGNGHI